MTSSDVAIIMAAAINAASKLPNCTTSMDIAQAANTIAFSCVARAKELETRKPDPHDHYAGG